MHFRSDLIEDIVVFSKSFEEHCKHLDQVFKAIADSGLTLSPNKCHIAYESLLLLGQKVSCLGLSTHKEKVEAILQPKPPKNVTFLGMMTYFSDYIPFNAWIVALLFSLLKKSITWKWTHLEQQAFELAREALSSAPVMAYPMKSQPYRIYSNACDYGSAAMLQPGAGNRGKQRPDGAIIHSISLHHSTDERGRKQLVQGHLV